MRNNGIVEESGIAGGTHLQASAVQTGGAGRRREWGQPPERYHERRSVEGRDDVGRGNRQ